MRFKNKIKVHEVEVNELVDKDLNLISGDDNETQTEITSYSTTDDTVDMLTQPTGPHFFPSAKGISEQVDDLTNEVMENILAREMDVDMAEIPAIDALKDQQAIVEKNLQILIDSMKRRSLDRISTSIVINEILNNIDVTTIPRNFKSILVRKLQGTSTSNTL